VAAQTKYGSIKVVCQGILHIERGFSKSVHSANEDFEYKEFDFWNLSYEKVSKSKMDFFKMDTSVRSTKDPDPAWVGSQQIIALYIVSASNP
jgi:hypothetical protein